MNPIKTFLIPLCALAFAAPTFAQQRWWVDANAPPGGDGSSGAPFDTIQEGIDAAVSGLGNTVVVLPGTYLETINFNGKTIAVRARGGPGMTKIDADGLGASAVTFESGENRRALLQGFTIDGGLGTGGYGGGILCKNASSPRIVGNVIEDAEMQVDHSWGGGIACLEGSSPRIVGNTIRDNYVGSSSFGYTGKGGGLYCDSGSPDVLQNVFTGNFAAWNGGAMAFEGTCSPLIDGNVVQNNVATDFCGGILLSAGSPMLMNNLIVENGSDGGAAGVNAGSSTLLTMVNCTIANNFSMSSAPGMSAAGPSYVVNSILWGNDHSSTGDGVGVTQLGGGGAHVSYCDIQNGPGTNSVASWGTAMLSADPLFVSGYFLSQVAAGQALDSPCVDAGSRLVWMPDWTTRTDGTPDEGACDMGFHDF